jgi:hypothetical protein
VRVPLVKNQDAIHSFVFFSTRLDGSTAQRAAPALNGAALSGVAQTEDDSPELGTWAALGTNHVDVPQFTPAHPRSDPQHIPHFCLAARLPRNKSIHPHARLRPEPPVERQSGN